VAASSSNTKEPLVSRGLRKRMAATSRGERGVEVELPVLSEFMARVTDDHRRRWGNARLLQEIGGCYSFCFLVF